MKGRDILAEIRAIRDELAQRYGGDAWALARANLSDHVGL